MSRTKSQIRKQSKKKSREKRNRKQKNIRGNNLGDEKWVLKVLIDGTWLEAKRFRNWDSVLKFNKETERLREAGDVIVPGKVFSIETGDVVMEIAGSDKKGIMPDKLAGKDEAIDKAKPGFLKRASGKE